MSYFGLTKKGTLGEDCAQFQLLVEQADGTFEPTEGPQDGNDLKLLAVAFADGEGGEEIGLVVDGTAKVIAGEALDKFALVSPAANGRVAEFDPDGDEEVCIGRITEGSDVAGDIVEISLFTPYIITDED